MPDIASTALKRLTIIPTIFGLSLLYITFADWPAEFAAMKFVVIVESTTIIIPDIPRFARSIACAIVTPTPMFAISIPIMYIQRLAMVYAVVDSSVAVTGFSTSFV